MKKFMKSILRKTGWELRRVDNSRQSNTRATMQEGLRWLSSHNFHFKTVLDVGASDGCWSKDCMKYFPMADYILFEPQPVHSDALDKFAQSCGKNVKIIKKAVGATIGDTFFDAKDPFGGALLQENKDSYTIKVEMTTIEDSVSQIDDERPYLMKLDTHGYEKSILEGAGKTLEKIDVLIIEAYNYKFTNEGLLFWELCAYLSDRGFRPIDLVDVDHRKFDNSLWQMDLFFIRNAWEGFNYGGYW
jgi:FkbM family methyltransferase